MSTAVPKYRPTASAASAIPVAEASAPVVAVLVGVSSLNPLLVLLLVVLLTAVELSDALEVVDVTGAGVELETAVEVVFGTLVDLLVEVEKLVEWLVEKLVE